MERIAPWPSSARPLFPSPACELSLCVRGRLKTELRQKLIEAGFLPAEAKLQTLRDNLVARATWQAFMP